MRLVPRATVMLAVCSLLGGERAAAQRVLSSIDVAGTTVSYADSVRASGVSVSPAIRLDWSRATLGANVDLSGLAGGNVSTQGTLAPSIFTPSFGPFSLEVAGSLGGSTHEDGTHTGQMLGIARGYLMGEGRGVWAGGGAGRTWDGSVWRIERQGDFGGWLDRGGATTVATITPVAVADSIAYTDVQLALRYPARSYELGLSIGARAGDTGPAVGGTSRFWGSASVVSWLSGTMAIVASAGTYPVDLTQGFPGGRFATLALRFASRNTRLVEREEARAESTPTERGDDAPMVAGFSVEPAGGNRRLLRVRAPGASRVEISGDFTRWQPVPLTRDGDGWWTTSQVIAAGTYEMDVRVDGGRWLAPPGLLTSRDEFGGVTGLLTIK